MGSRSDRLPIYYRHVEAMLLSLKFQAHDSYRASSLNNIFFVIFNLCLDDLNHNPRDYFIQRSIYGAVPSRRGFPGGRSSKRQCCASQQTRAEVGRGPPSSFLRAALSRQCPRCFSNDCICPPALQSHRFVVHRPVPSLLLYQIFVTTLFWLAYFTHWWSGKPLPRSVSYR